MIGRISAGEPRHAFLLAFCVSIVHSIIEFEKKACFEAMRKRERL